MTLGAAATAGVRLTVWCKGCPRQARLTSRRGQTIPRSDFGSRLAAAGHRRPRGVIPSGTARCGRARSLARLAKSPLTRISYSCWLGGPSARFWVSGDRARTPHLRQTGPTPQTITSEAAESRGSFTARYEISFGGVKPKRADRAPVGYGLPQPPVGPRQSAKG